MKFPNKVELANLPTPIVKLGRSLSLLNEDKRGVNIYVKRDDMTGSEASGNKLRKLEYTIAEALSEGAKTLVTCGGIQSNHCRATAVVAASLGLDCHLVLSHDGMEKGDEPTTACREHSSVVNNGNLFVNRLMGAEITYISGYDYSRNRNGIMEAIKEKYDAQGRKSYIIPEGASDGTGIFGYANAYYEIERQEKELGVKFDTIAVSSGSAGTVGGIYIASEAENSGRSVLALLVSKKDDSYLPYIKNMVNDARVTGGFGEIAYDNLHLLPHHGLGYAVSKPDELEFIKRFATLEGIMLDPVYTGKGMYGLFKEVNAGSLYVGKNILFIHTGGQYGVFPKTELFTL